MRKTLTKLTASVLLILPMISTAGDDTVWQHNTELKLDNLKFQHRIVNDDDYDHMQLGYTFYKSDAGTKYGIAYRIAEEGDKDENRTILTVEPSWKVGAGKLSFKNYIEYRDFDHKSDHFRYKGKLKYSQKVGDFKPYASTRLKYSEVKHFEGNELELGTSYKFNPIVSLTGFYRYETDKDWHHKGDMVGTKLTFKF